MMNSVDQFEDVTGVIGCGIYLLLWRGVVVYVGQAERLVRRIYQHRNLYERGRKGERLPPGQRAIRFDQVMVHHCTLSQLDTLEREAILAFAPRYNVKHLPPKPKVTLAQAGFSMTTLLASVSKRRMERRF